MFDHFLENKPYTMEDRIGSKRIEAMHAEEKHGIRDVAIEIMVYGIQNM